MASRAHGIHGEGQRTFTPRQAADVCQILERAGPTRRLRVEDIATSLGIPGRTVRAILSEHDGETFLLGGGDDGYFLAEVGDDADVMTRRLEHQVGKMVARIGRRRQFAARLERRQDSFFGAEDAA